MGLDVMKKCLQKQIINWKQQPISFIALYERKTRNLKAKNKTSIPDIDKETEKKRRGEREKIEMGSNFPAV